MISPIGMAYGTGPFGLAFTQLPGAEVEVIPAWLYFVGPMVTMMMGALAATVISHYRKVQVGKLVPESTVDRMRSQYESRIQEMNSTHAADLAGLRSDRDAERVAKQRDIDDWRGAYHIQQSAYVELSQLIDENTDALKAFGPAPRVIQQIEPPRTDTDPEASNARRGGRERA